jgi:hypothetical protein
MWVPEVEKITEITLLWIRTRLETKTSAAISVLHQPHYDPNTFGSGTLHSTKLVVWIREMLLRIREAQKHPDPDADSEHW